MVQTWIFSNAFIAPPVKHRCIIIDTETNSCRVPDEQCLEPGLTLNLKVSLMTTSLTVSARGQVTFRRDVLRHLGLRPGDKLELELVPGGCGLIRAVKPAGSMAGFIGSLSGRTAHVATIEEMNAATAEAWAAKK